MKKALLLVSILFISVVTTACINNFAVQELNNKAMTFMEQGNYKEAIGRLKSSVDLDDSIFETHYNLAVAYTKDEDYADAIESYKKALSLKPDYADAYYSLAVAQENLASDLVSGALIMDENGAVQKPVESDVEDDKKDDAKAPELSASTTSAVKKLMDEAVLNYEAYLAKAIEAKDAQEVQGRVTDLKAKAAQLLEPKPAENTLFKVE